MASERFEREMARPGYWRCVADDVRHELPGLLGANALFLVWCTPPLVLAMVGLPALAAIVAPVMIGPGLAGLGAYVGRLARGDGARWWRDSVTGARTRSTACAILMAVTLGAVVLPVMALPLMTVQGATTGTVALFTVQALVAVGLVLTGIHGLGLVALYGQPASTALRNAALLTIRHPLSSAGPIGLGLLFVHVAQLFGWGPLVVLPAVLALCAVHHTRRLVEDVGTITSAASQERPCPLP